jgi:muramidase (phage lysozyme)
MPTVKQYRDDPTKQNKELLKNPSVQAMLKTIRYAEGTAGDRGYNTRVGYSEFDDLSKKPGKKVFIPSINDFSSAEGAYQFLNSTWDGVSKKLGLKDFSPESQDLAAIELIKNRGALTDVLNNNLDGALTKLSGEWASLPTASGKSAYKNQNSKKAQDLYKVFFSNLENPKQNEGVTLTTTVNQLEIPKVIGTFAGVSESNDTEEETDKKPLKEAEEVQQQTNEYNFLKDYQQQFAQQEEQQPIQIPTIDVEQTVNEVNQFVDTEIAQQGVQLKFLQPNDKKLPIGYQIPYNTPSSEKAMSIGGENGEPAYLIPTFKYGKPLADPIEEFKKTGEHLGGGFKTWQEAEKWEQEVRHPAVERGEAIQFPIKEFQQGGKPVADNNGYWNPKNWGKNVKIDGGEITMEKVGVPLIGRADTGETKLMLPEQNYSFKNANHVIESPLTKEEQSFLQEYLKYNK